jgi:hypothetical protein
MGRFNVQGSLNRVNTTPIAEKIASKEEQTTKRYNKVSPTESRSGRILLVSLR